jgi:hypothetical protein
MLFFFGAHLFFFLLVNSSIAYGSLKNNDILLIINYNHAHYNSVQLLRELYEPYFPHIEFYGPKPHSQVRCCYHDAGWYGYKVLADAMNKFPHYKGYLFTNDDCIIHPWNLHKYDDQKIWCIKPYRAKLEKSAVAGWAWHKHFAFPAVSNAFQMLSTHYRNALEKNYGSNTIAWGYSDIVYVPARLRQDIIALCALFESSRTFLEIAFPTMLSCLEETKNMEFLNGIAVWDRDKDLIQQLCTPDVDFFHPLKLSAVENQLFIKNYFEKKLKE